MSVRKYEWTQVNFTAADRLTIESVDHTGNENIGQRLVSVYQRGASMRFQFDMTPAHDAGPGPRNGDGPDSGG